MKNKIFTLPILFLAITGSALGYYFGAINQRSKSIVVAVNNQPLISVGNTQVNKIKSVVAKPVTPTASTKISNKTIPTPTSSAIKSKPIVTTTVKKTSAVKIPTKTVVPVAKPVIQQPAAPAPTPAAAVTTPTPTTKAS
ncbi:MAG: hypothetical protein WCG01_01915 [bacterium]